jgi:hypothetical protein
MASKARSMPQLNLLIFNAIIDIERIGNGIQANIVHYSDIKLNFFFKSWTLTTHESVTKKWTCGFIGQLPVWAATLAAYQTLFQKKTEVQRLKIVIL